MLEFLGVDLKDCWARKILAAERDNCEQKGRLQEEIKAPGHKVIFYPKFHCEPNPIEPYRDGLQYGCEEFKNRVYKAHCRIEDKSKR